MWNFTSTDNFISYKKFIAQLLQKVIKLFKMDPTGKSESKISVVLCEAKLPIMNGDLSQNVSRGFIISHLYF
jgi:hypothetical protein